MTIKSLRPEYIRTCLGATYWSIVGAAGTPYHDGLFFFDIVFPSEAALPLVPRCSKCCPYSWRYSLLLNWDKRSRVYNENAFSTTCNGGSFVINRRYSLLYMIRFSCFKPEKCEVNQWDEKQTVQAIFPLQALIRWTKLSNLYIYIYSFLKMLFGNTCNYLLKVSYQN